MQATRAVLERQASAVIELKRRRSLKRTVFGIVCPEKGLLYAITSNKKGDWFKTEGDIDCYIPAKAEVILKSNKRFIVLLGGRGSGKSVVVTDIRVAAAKDNGSKTYFLREFQSSIKNSVYSLVKDEIARHGYDGFTVLNQSIGFKDASAFEFAGLARNVDSVKSTHGFECFAVEESQFVTQTSLDSLTATLRNKPKNGLPLKFVSVIDDIDSNANIDNISMIFVANPGSSEDPFSKRFIEPFKSQLDKDGIYEDDLHLIVKMNCTDNPWFDDSGLDGERQWDLEHRSSAFYEHKWAAEYNDSVDDGLIMSEWFDACIDAHLKLGFKPEGEKIAAFDPSDTGPDSKGYAMRHGSVFLSVEEKTDGDVNEGGDWATGLAIQQGVNYFTWDCDGLGVGLNRQMASTLTPKGIRIAQYKGSESPDNPESVYKPALGYAINGVKLVKDTFRNKRCQYYYSLQDRCYNTYRAVVHGEYLDPAKLVSFSSNITELKKLRAELCRMPVKPNDNGYLDLYTKQEMKNKFKIKSPNLGDAVKMSLRYIDAQQANSVMPNPIKPMRTR